MDKSDRAQLCRHLAFAAVGGFFGAYAILCRGGIMANAQTMNLLELVIQAARGDLGAILLHLGSLALYVLGTMLTVLLPYRFGANMRRVAPLLDGFVCVILCFIPEDANAVAALYPIFFAMSVQWSSFSGARGYVSSTIFSTNNTKQASLAAARYLTEGDRAQLEKAKFYLYTLLCFHIGAAVSVGAVYLMGVRGAWVNLGLVALAYVAVLREEQAAAVDSPTETT